jgi:hypothetical protein
MLGAATAAKLAQARLAQMHPLVNRGNLYRPGVLGVGTAFMPPNLSQAARDLLFTPWGAGAPLVVPTSLDRARTNANAADMPPGFACQGSYEALEEARNLFEAALGAGSPHSAFEEIVARVISTSYIVRPATADGNEEQLYSHMATEDYLADWGLVT